MRAAIAPVALAPDLHRLCAHAARKPSPSAARPMALALDLRSLAANEAARAPSSAACLRRSMGPSVRRAGEEAARTQHENDEEGEVPGQDLPFGIDRRSHRLGHADDDAARQRAPEAAEPADDDRLEGVEQAGGADGGVEVGTHPEIERGHPDHHHRHRHGQREHPAVVDAHQLRDLGIVRGGAEGPAQLGAIEQELQSEDDADGRCQREQLHCAHRHAAAQRQRGRLDGACAETLAVGREHLQQAVLDDDRQAEGDQQRRHDVPAERAVEQNVLQRVAEPEQKRHGQQRRQERIEPQRLCHHQHDERRQHDQVAVGEIDEPHDAEDQRQPGREQRVEPAQHHALQHGVDHAAHVPKYAV